MSFNNPRAPTILSSIIIILLISACKSPVSDVPLSDYPYQVIGPDSTDLYRFWGVNQYVPLEIDSPDGSLDPNPGDVVGYNLSYDVTDPVGFILTAFSISVVDVGGVPNLEIFSKESENYILEVRVDAEDGDGNITLGLPLTLIFGPTS